MVNQSRRRKKLVQLHTAHRDFKDDTRKVGDVLGLLSEKVIYWNGFDEFRKKLRGYVERKVDNAKYVMCVVTEMGDPTKPFEEDNMPKGEDED